MKKIFIKGILSETVVLEEDKTHHLLHVLRHPLHIPVILGDEKGNSGRYQLKQENEGEVVAHLLEYLSEENNDIEIILVQSFLKGEKFEWILQKCTELNCSSIYAIPTVHCVAKYDEKKILAKETRWRKILEEASQQAGLRKVPAFSCASNFNDVLKQYEDALLLVAYENEDKTTLKEVLSKNTAKKIVIFVGPEGGYAQKEIKALQTASAKTVSLGKTILRAETAAVAAVAMIAYEVNM